MTQLPTTTSIQLELTQGWLSIWFNQPERRNPLTDAVVHEIAQVLSAVADDRSIRGITFRGRGGFFCAGGDLTGFQRLASGAREEAMATSTLIGQLLAQLNRQPQVTLALIEGAAMAGGLGLACCCDVAIGTADARFAFSETRIGISPAQIARYVLQKCGYATGRRLMLTAARFQGREAADFGLLDAVVDDASQLSSAEMAIKAEVLSCAPAAIAATKALIVALPDIEEDERIHAAAANFTRALQGDEGREGVASFLEKRKPNWHVALEPATEN